MSRNIMKKPDNFTLLDRFISVFSPEMAARRLENRIYISMMRGYDAAKTDRLHGDWLPVIGTGEQVDRGARELIRGRARQLELNSDMAEGIVNAIVRNVVGKGIRPQARVRNTAGELDTETNRTLEDAWKKWRRSEFCDVSGQNTFEEIQELVMRRFLYDGEAFAHLVYDAKARFPLSLQLIEPERVGSYDQIAKNGNKVVAGVEMTDYYKPVQYWIYDQDPIGFTTYQARPYPASSIIHFWKRSRPSQVRGVSQLARVMTRIRQIDEYLNADLVSARTAACFSAFVVSPNGKWTANANSKDRAFKPGMIGHLRPGEDIRFAEPKRNAGTASEYAKTQGRKVATGVGVSYDLVTRDIQGNFSAARQNMLEDRKTFEPLQQFLIDHFCQRIWEEFVKSCYLSGILKVPDFSQDPERYYSVNWLTPGWSWIDPTKEVMANKESIKAGLTTMADVCASQGLDWEEVFEQQAQERQRAEELGIELDVFNPASNFSSPSDDKNDGEEGDPNDKQTQ